MVSYAVSPQLMSKIIPETCLAINKALKDEYLKFPSSAEEWKQIAEEFQNKWQYPNCVGAMDGKHIRITKPYSSGSLYYNYKKYFSVVTSMRELKVEQLILVF
ncbi:hypothetical protein PYW08_006268 [Mythimna loreyi]|uniref:Uncharacterized protein n=1 Tax=Mythimna loreyi TaxID=667449 RepID=A0ACC2QMQ3_9NEOP|nr:hypothetical protein PYW08_006268 [Mythimna loreyi]